jgi:hypothetical protein
MKMNPPKKIHHPMADEISIQDGQYHYCTPGVSSEIAFFMNRKWVTKHIEPFSPYADSIAGDTMVYGHVPNELIDEFLKEWG